MTDTRVIVLVGSLRADSLNRRIAEVLRDQAPAGVTLELIDGLAELPFYNEDLDGENVPAAAAALRDKVAAADRVLAVTPEYNGTMPAVLNNAIDWLSRPFGTGAIKGKPFGVVGATPTPYGGKWAHADTARSAGIAGAIVVEDVTVSQSALEVDVLLFPLIGMFPVIMVVSALVFFDASWPRRLEALARRFLRPSLGRVSVAPGFVTPISAPPPAAAGRWMRVGVAAAGVFMLIQVVVPLRSHFYGGNVLWHEQGMRFSWRVMSRAKNGSVTFNVRDPGSDRHWQVSPTKYLTRMQEREMAVQPDLILQLAHHISRDFAAKGPPGVEVYADARASLNGRSAELLVDPTIDLARQLDEALGPGSDEGTLQPTARLRADAARVLAVLGANAARRCPSRFTSCPAIAESRCTPPSATVSIARSSSLAADRFST